MTEITFIEDFTHIYKTLLQGGITQENIYFAHAELTHLFEQYHQENEEMFKETDKMLAKWKSSNDRMTKEIADIISLPIELCESEVGADETIQGIDYPEDTQWLSA